MRASTSSNTRSRERSFSNTGSGYWPTSALKICGRASTQCVLSRPQISGSEAPVAFQGDDLGRVGEAGGEVAGDRVGVAGGDDQEQARVRVEDRKSTRLNSSH